MKNVIVTVIDSDVEKWCVVYVQPEMTRHKSSRLKKLSKHTVSQKKYPQHFRL